MTQEEEIQFVLDVTARAAREVIEQIRTGDLNGWDLGEENLRRLVTWAMNPLREAAIIPKTLGGEG